MRKLDYTTTLEIWKVLVTHCGVSDERSPKHSFVFAYSDPQDGAPREYRFGGLFGMAGKFWWNNDRFYVSGNSRGDGFTEAQLTDEAEIIRPINEKLAAIYKQFELRRERDGIIQVIPAFRESELGPEEQLEILRAVAEKLGLRRALDGQ